MKVRLKEKIVNNKPDCKKVCTKLVRWNLIILQPPLYSGLITKSQSIIFFFKEPLLNVVTRLIWLYFCGLSVWPVGDWIVDSKKEHYARDLYAA